MARAGHAIHLPQAYWNRDADVLLGALGASRTGLSARQAAARQRRFGANRVEETDETHAGTLLLRQFSNPLVLILLFGATVSLVLREWTEAAIIIAVVLGSALLGFAQEYRANAAMAGLRRRLALQARVRRQGRSATLPASALVPGDIVELSAGNLVPADGVVLEARDFLVTEAALTGEPFPVEKRPGIVAVEATLAARGNCVFLGTSVRSGTATVLVVQTGRATVLGALAGRLRQRPRETAFAHGLRQFGQLLLRVMLVTVVFVLAVNQWLGRPMVESLLFAVALAVGLSPELLPAIVSVTLSHGARAMAKRGVIVRRLEAIENLGSMDVLATDKTGTLTAGVIALSEAVDAAGERSKRVLELAYLNASLETGIDNPLDAAIVAAGRGAGLAEPAPQRKVDEIPYDFIRKRLTIVVDDGEGAHRIVTKGAFANVLSVCTQMAQADGEAPLDGARLDALQRLFEDWGRNGIRVLAVATRRVAARSAYHHDDEAGMTLAGFLLFLDPPKPQVQQTLADLAALGIAIKVITGDNRHVAAHLARTVGIDTSRLLTGEEIATLNDESLWQRAAHTDLFVEVDPQQKERIVRALQRSGHRVGYLGDGINDAPALQAADVGISVDGAVDVARASADIVLLRPDLDVLRAGVQEGRRTFANTLKYIAMTTSANFGNMMSMAAVTPLLPFQPLLAKQILLNNLLSDVPSVAVATDRVDPDLVQTAPRWDVHEVRRFMLVFGLVSSAFDLLTFAVLLKGFGADEATFHTGWFVVSVLTELVVVLVLRTHRASWRSRPGTLLATLTVAVAALVCSVPYAGSFAALFGFVPMPASLLAACAAITLAYLAVTEGVKAAYFRRLRAPA